MNKFSLKIIKKQKMYGFKHVYRDYTKEKI